MRTIVLAGGCFWGMEDLFRKLEGVISTTAGYAGGKNDDPTYEFHPGHAESLKIDYDENITSLEKILDFFFRIHDPTTLNRQGNDVGDSYRSAIFYGSEDDRQLSEKFIARVDASGAWKDKVVTSLEKLNKFYDAEDYHQDYLQKNPGGYTCHYIRNIKSYI